MTQMKKTILRSISCALASVLTVAILLTGCGGDVPASSVPAASSSPAASTPASSTPASSTPASSKPAASTPASSTPASSTPASTGIKIDVTSTAEGYDLSSDYFGQGYLLGADLTLTNTSSKTVTVAGLVTREELEKAQEQAMDKYENVFWQAARKALSIPNLSEDNYEELLTTEAQRTTFEEILAAYAGVAQYAAVYELSTSACTAVTPKGNLKCLLLREDDSSDKTLAAGKSMPATLIVATDYMTTMTFYYQGTAFHRITEEQFKAYMKVFQED